MSCLETNSFVPHAIYASNSAIRVSPYKPVPSVPRAGHTLTKTCDPGTGTMHRLDAYNMVSVLVCDNKNLGFELGGADGLYGIASESEVDGFGTYAGDGFGIAATNLFTERQPDGIFNYQTGPMPPYSVPRSLTGTVSCAGPVDSRFVYGAASQAMSMSDKMASDPSSPNYEEAVAYKRAVQAKSKSIGTVYSSIDLEPLDSDWFATKH